MRAKFPRIEILALVKSAHAAQFRNNGRVPYWMHLQATAEILEWAFVGTQETHDDDLRDDLYAAALGHDLYEDTTVRREDIVAKFGPRVDAWIQAMTNDGDDGNESDRSAYLARLASGPEEARLIKLADLIENMASCTLPRRWQSRGRAGHAWRAVDGVRLRRSKPYQVDSLLRLSVYARRSRYRSGGTCWRAGSIGECRPRCFGARCGGRVLPT